MLFAIIDERDDMSESISFGVTIILYSPTLRASLTSSYLSSCCNLFRYSFDSAFSCNLSINISIPSDTSVASSTTVGIPIATTGIPNEVWLISCLVFPTPAPGTIPVSDICIVLLILSILLDAKASITINNLGFILSTIPFNISTVSIPVVPRTPGEIALTGLVPSSTYCGNYFIICLVTSISLITFGPKASGVTYIFPNPTINISPCLSV